MELSELRKTPHLSASGVNEYVECSLLYRFGRVDRLPMEFVAAELEFGTVIHKVLEEFYRAKMIGEKPCLKTCTSCSRRSGRRRPPRGRTFNIRRDRAPRCFP